MIPELFAAAALLLAVAGAAKARRPGPAGRLVSDLVGRRVARIDDLVRVLGVAELAVAVVALVTGGRAAAVLVAAGYAVFAAVAVRQLGGGRPRRACGCFGAADGPVGPAHLVLDAVAFGAALAAVLDPPGRSLLAGPAPTVTIAVLQVGLLTALGYLAVTALPALLATTREAL